MTSWFSRRVAALSRAWLHGFHLVRTPQTSIEKVERLPDCQFTQNIVFRAPFKNKITAKSPIYQDFRRGILFIQDFLSHAPGNAFYKLEEIRLRYRLANIQKKLFDAYRIFGMQVFDVITGKAPKIVDEERDRAYQRIAALRDDQQRIEAEMEELRSFATSRSKRELDGENKNDGSHGGH